MAKAGRPKKGSAGLPAWFDIEKYRATKSFKAVSWFQQLACRKSFYDYATRIGVETDPLFEGNLSRALDLIKSDPVITEDRILRAPVRKFPNGMMFLDEALGNATRAMCAHRIGVRDAHNIDIKNAYAAFPDDVRQYAETHYSCIADTKDGRVIATSIDGDVTDVTEANKFMEAAYDGKPIAMVMVDFSLTDKALLHEFGDYLKNKSERVGAVKSPFFRNSDFGSWYNSGVLPYLDLKLWSDVTGESLRWSAFANALSQITDKPIGSESSLQKTTKQYAAKLSDERTLRILQSQIQREQSGKLKKSGKLVVR